MKCKKRKGLNLQRGIAIFLLLLMGWATFGVTCGQEAFAAETERAKVSFTKQIKYENYYTYNYKVTVNGEKKVAYCVEPTKHRPLQNTFDAESYNDELMRKILYYSYGYPGYSKTKSYLSGVSRKSCYKGTDGIYVLSHLLLSYAYDNKSSSSDAFHGLSSASKKMLKEVMAEMETWPDPVSEGGFSLDKTSVTAQYSSESGMQETPKIKLNADSDNSITVEVPEKTILVKTSEDGSEEEFDSENIESVTVAGGESFRFKAPKDMEGEYESPQMSGTEGGFQSFIITKNSKQNLVFALDKSESLSFTIQWSPSAEVSINTSASEKSSGAKEIDAGGEVTVVDEVSYEGLDTSKEYTVKGRLMDKKTGKEVEGVSAEKTFKPDKADGSVEIEFVMDSSVLAGKSLVAFEKLYCGDELIASHEDINDDAQTVVIKESEKSPKPAAVTDTDKDTEPPKEEPTGEQPKVEPEATPVKQTDTPDKIVAETPEKVVAETPENDSQTPSELPANTVNAQGESPITGDESHIAFAFMAMAAAMLAAGCTLVFRKSLL